MQPIKALLLTVKGLVLHILFDHHIGDHAHIGFETVVLPRRAGYPLMTSLAGQLGIHVDVHLILNRQLDQLLTRILPHLDQGRMIGATRTEGLRGINGVFDPSTRQMRWKTATAVRASFAFLLLVSGLVCRGFFFRLFFLGFRRGIPRAFLLGQLFPRLRGGFGNPGLQLLGIDLFRTRTKEAPFVNGHRVLQVASNRFQLLDLSLKGLLFGLPGLRLGLQRLELLAQSLVLLRQPLRSVSAAKLN